MSDNIYLELKFPGYSFRHATSSSNLNGVPQGALSTISWNPLNSTSKGAHLRSSFKMEAHLTRLHLGVRHDTMPYDCGSLRHQDVKKFESRGFAPNTGYNSPIQNPFFEIRRFSPLAAPNVACLSLAISRAPSVDSLAVPTYAKIAFFTETAYQKPVYSRFIRKSLISVPAHALTHQGPQKNRLLHLRVSQCVLRASSVPSP